MIRKITGYALVALTIGASACASPTKVAAPTETQLMIAVTVDDVPRHNAMAPGETRFDISRRLVDALKAEGVPAYGFVNGSPAQADPDDMAALEYWAAAFPIGNHTWTHPNLNALTADAYSEEIARGEPLLERLSLGRDWHWFRYPFLAEGDDPAKKQKVRQFLSSHGYRIAAVTMSSNDLDYNDAYARCAAKRDQAAVAKLEADWMDAIRYNANKARAVAKAVYGRDIPYVLLTHIGSFDVRMFPRTLALYREMGFRFTSLPDAQNDPAYADSDDPAVPPKSDMYETMKATGMPLPADRVPTVDLGSMCR